MPEPDQPEPPDPVGHRGRVQAQGADMGRTESEPWARPNPPTVSEVLSLLEVVWDRLARKEQEARKDCYRKARQFIENRRDEGPIEAPYSKSFTNRKTRGAIRIDLEVHTGKACVADG